MAASCRQCFKPTHISVILIIFLIFLESSCPRTTAIRPLGAEQRLRKSLVIQSLPKGPVPPSGSSPCTYIPGGKSHGRCAMAVDEEFSGHPAAAPKEAAAAAAFPPVVVHFAEASGINEFQRNS